MQMKIEIIEKALDDATQQAFSLAMKSIPRDTPHLTEEQWRENADKFVILSKHAHAKKELDKLKNK